MARTPKQVSAEARTERLLDVAATFFLEKGYEGTSVSEIAREAHASKETFYSRYSSKAELFLAVMRRQTDRTATELNAVLVPNTPIEEALESFGVVIVGRIISQSSLSMHRVLALESARFPDLPRLFFEMGPARVLATLSRYLCEQMVLGRLRKLDAEAAAHHFLSLCTAETMMRVNLGIKPIPTPEEARRKVKAAVNVFLHGYAR